MKTLVFVVNHGGYFLSHRLPLALAARQAGYDVHIATPRSRHTNAIAAAGLSWHEIRLSRSGLNPLAELRTVYDLAQLYRALRPDIVHHVTSKPVLYGTLASRLAGVPAVVNALAGLGHVFIARDLRHTFLRSLIGAGYRLVLRRPNMKVIFQNADDRGVFVASGAVRVADTVLIAGSGVDPEIFKPSMSPDKSRVPLVIFASRMLRSKGLIEFLDAVKLLNGRRVEARYALVGEPDPDNPASMTESDLRSAQGPNVEYWGRRADMAAIFQEADIVCLPSHREGLPKVLIEAASCGLPVVTTDVPGCRDVVRNGENGLLVPLRNPGAIADALETLITRPDLRRSMGAHGRNRVLREFSLSAVIDATLAVYEAVSP
jgi:glycosyltransferase involved in cell wall biosynthesis